MKKIVLVVMFVVNIFAAPKILHLSFHKGCINDFDYVARELGLEVTPWFILENRESLKKFDDQSNGNEAYNVGHERAARIWQKHKEYFDSFDAIITSDTAPLSRIFLQGGWKKPLIIWVCNRFDYFDSASLDCDFPDQEYYDLFAQAVHQKNIKIISYTPYEYFYALKKGINMGDFIIKPLGISHNPSKESAIPHYIIKNKTFFIPPRLSDEQREFLLKRCQELGIPTYCGNYNGSHDLKDFKGIIHFPYAWSNVALFENIQNGLIHFIPSIVCIKNLIGCNEPVAYFALKNLEWAEWYRPENNDLFVYFDSWQDLKNKIEEINYLDQKENIYLFAQNHKKTMLERWKSVFDYFNL